jgi:3-oxoacyl-[acyl-carrier-protein] synthase III
LKLSLGNTVQPLLTFDITNAGLGWLNAVHVAASLIAPDRAPNIIITASECDENKKSSLGLPLNLSELATATLLKPSNGISGFSNFHFRSFTADIGLRDVKYLASGASGCHVKKEFPNYEDELAIAVSQTVQDQLKVLGASLDDFAALIIPQRSHTFLQKVADKLQMSSAKLVDISCDTDHFSTSIPLALATIVDNSSYQPGDQVLVVDAAPGIQVGMAIYVI